MDGAIERWRERCTDANGKERAHNQHTCETSQTTYTQNVNGLSHQRHMKWEVFSGNTKKKKAHNVRNKNKIKQNRKLKNKRTKFAN